MLRSGFNRCYALAEFSDCPGDVVEFFDSDGRAVCYCIQSGRIFAWNGKPLGSVRGNKVHTCSGKFVGWLSHGFLMNQLGECCLFTQGADERLGPDLPTTRHRPPKAPRQYFPDMRSRKPAPSIPEIIPAWGPNPFRGPVLRRLLSAFS